MRRRHVLDYHIFPTMVCGVYMFKSLNFMQRRLSTGADYKQGFVFFQDCLVRRDVTDFVNDRVCYDDLCTLHASLRVHKAGIS
ncbi:unnamed protein product [Ixodes pacificus]